MTVIQGRMSSLLAAASLLLLGWAFLMPDRDTKADPPPEKRKREQFASDRDVPPSAAKESVKIDTDRCMGYLKKLCDMGPAISGSETIGKKRELLKSHFEKLGAKVELQKFNASQLSQRRPVEMVNVIISWFPERERRVMFCSHYDTRPRADQEPDRTKWNEPFVSANDGTSGVALFMELAHHMKELSTGVGVDFVLFDGEEYVFDGPYDGKDRYFIGSEYFAGEYKRQQSKQRYVAAILLDLFAGKNPAFPFEQNSYFRAQALSMEVWGIAAELGVTSFQNKLGPSVLDDHLALQKVGIPAIDIIDFDYPHWHRLSDRPENCSPTSFEEVARVLTVWLKRAR